MPPATSFPRDIYSFSAKLIKKKKVIYRAPSCGKQYPFFQNGVGGGGMRTRELRRKLFKPWAFSNVKGEDGVGELSGQLKDKETDD